MNTRFTIFTALCLLGSMPGLADEKLPVLKVGNDIFTDVVVTTLTATDVYFTYNNGKGMANAKLKSLDPDLQKHFHYNPEKAGEAEQKQAQANAEYHSFVISQPVARPPDESWEQSASATQTSELSWGTDLPGALNQARLDNKMVLLDFTGSDWCPWCIKFDHDVLSTGEFANYAANKLVLVKLDFPRHADQSATLKEANHELSQRFNVSGYPTYVLLDQAGYELGRQVGYRDGGPNAFIAELEDFSKR